MNTKLNKLITYLPVVILAIIIGLSFVPQWIVKIGLEDSIDQIVTHTSVINFIFFEHPSVYILCGVYIPLICCIAFSCFRKVISNKVVSILISIICLAIFGYTMFLCINVWLTWYMTLIFTILIAVLLTRNYLILKEKP